MDGCGYLHSDQGDLQKHAHKSPVRELLTGSGERGGEHDPRPILGVNGNRHVLGWWLDPEFILEIHLQEGRNVKALFAVLIDGVRVAFDREHVAMSFAECIMNLVDDGCERPNCVMAEIDAERIEAVPEGARHAQELDFSAFDVDANRRKLPFDLETESGGGSVAMIGVVQAEKVRVVVREKTQA
jgi:hypothetical protein